MKRIVFIALAAVASAGCQQTSGLRNMVPIDQTVAIAEIDSVNNAFNAAWNKKDSAAIVGMFAEDIIMFTGKRMLRGRDELARKFVSTDLPVTGNLKVKKERVDASEGLGSEAGIYSLTVSLPGKSDFQQTGSYNFLWKKDAENKWEIVVINMHDH